MARGGDDANGIGVAFHYISRDGLLLGSRQTPRVTDETVQPGTSYNYIIQPCDYHGNCGPGTTVPVTTPPAGSLDPLRIGARPTGAYWGAGSEQIDMRSGNLNFSLPLLKAMGRGSWGVGFGLSYNSQVWRQDPGGVWRLGGDVGYGFGWRLAAGSLAAIWSDPVTVHHYVFTDASGGEYRLDVNNNGFWTSRDSIHLTYDALRNRLYFPDGSFWVFGACSSGAEDDSGIRYPTLMQDTNGNQLAIHYLRGAGTVWDDSSARIDYIDDVRAPAPQWNERQVYATYLFAYNADAVPHLTSIQSRINSGETYTFAYTANQPLYSPWGQAFGTTTLLSSVSNAIPRTNSFEYAGTGEMTRAVLPYGGDLRWTYRDFTYAGSRTLREVQIRSLVKSAGETPVAYGIIRNDAADANGSVHSWTVLYDPTGAQKVWWFDGNGEQSTFQDRAPGGAALRSNNLTWTQDGAGNRYIGTVLTTLENGQQTKVEQTQDDHGNITQTRVYNYGNLSTPARTYNTTYAHAAQWSGFADHFMFNLRSTTSVTDGTTGKTLESLFYDTVLTSVRSTNLRLYDWSVLNDTGMLRERGNVTSRWVPGRTTTYTYYTTGAVNTTTDSASGTATVTPTANESAPSVITPNGNTNLNVSLSYTPFQALTSATGPNGASVWTTYDAYGRVAGGGSTAVGGASVGYSGNLTTETKNGRWSKSTLDGLGRTIRVERGYGGPGSGGQATAVTESFQDYEYGPCACSPLGKVKRVSQPYAPGGTVYWTEYTYDGLGRTTQVRLPDNSTTIYTYTGNTVTVTDPAGKWKTYTSDVFGNLVQVTEPNPAGGDNYQTYYTYNLRNQLTGVSMPRGGATQTRTFTYNDDAQLTQSVNPETGTVNYTYNTDKLLASRTDNRGQKVEYTYDTYKRLTQVRRYPNGSTEDVCQRVDYAYDTNAVDSTFTQYGWGRRTTESFNVGCAAGLDRPFTYMYSYNQGGQVTKKALRHPVTSPDLPTDVVLNYAYDSEGRMTSITYPTIAPALNIGDEVYQYEYDNMGRVKKLGGIVDPILYGPAGRDPAVEPGHVGLQQPVADDASRRLGVPLHGGAEQRADHVNGGDRRGRGGLSVRRAEPAGEGGDDRAAMGQRVRL